MQNERFNHLAKRVREANDPASTAVNMVRHATGAQWVNVWSGISLLEEAIENGGTLTIPSFERGVPDKVMTAAELLERIYESLSQMSSNIDALGEALDNNPNT